MLLRVAAALRAGLLRSSAVSPVWGGPTQLGPIRPSHIDAHNTWQSSQKPDVFDPPVALIFIQKRRDGTENAEPYRCPIIRASCSLLRFLSRQIVDVSSE
jgi:hypothetical protein